MTKITSFAWFMVIVAILVWTGFGLLAWQLAEERAGYAAAKADAITRAQQADAGSRLATLVRDTKEQREYLEELSHADVIAAAATIEAAGEAAGAQLTIDGATEASRAEGAPSTLQASIVVASARGSLATLMRVVQLLETLPFPSVVEGVELRMIGDSADWHLTARIRIVTTSYTGA